MLQIPETSKKRRLGWKT